MTFLVIVVLIGLLPAMVAASKGRSFVGWWIYGSLLFIVALPHALLLKADQRALDARAIGSGDSKKCEHCAEIIRRDAKVCRYCGRDVAAPVASSEPAVDYLG